MIFLCIRYKKKTEDYERYIAQLETDAVEKKDEIAVLRGELKTCKDFVNKLSHCTSFAEDTSSAQYKEKIEELVQLLQDEEQKKMALEERLMDMDSQYQEINDILSVRRTIALIFYDC